jgi:phenylacetate-CoA ligase
MDEDIRKQTVLNLRDQYLNMSVTKYSKLEPLLRQELVNLIDFARANSPWWVSRLKDVDTSIESMSDLVRSLPITNRELIQNHFDEMTIHIPGTNQDDYGLQKTSGSSSHPVQVLKYWPSHSIDADAIVLLEWKWHDRDIRKKIGFFRLGASDSDFADIGSPLSYLGEAPTTFTRSSVDRTPGELQEALYQHQPSYLLTNPISLKLVAEQQQNHPMRIAPMDQILTLADRVDDSLRELTKEVFGAKIVDRYSSVEFGMIALQCPKYNHLHVISPNVYVEVVDENDQPVPNGTPGRVLITSLHGFAMPLFRYEQGDIVTMGESCDSGITWPVIESIHGRVRTYADGPDGSRRLLTLFTADFLLMREILDFRVIKFDQDVVFITQTREPLDHEAKARIIKSMEDVFRSVLPVRIIETTEALMRPKWKAKEIYLVPGSPESDWDIVNFKRILAESEGEQTKYISECP